MRKMTLDIYKTCSIEKTAKRDIKYAKSGIILKSGKNGHFEFAIAKQTGQKWLLFGLNFKDRKSYGK